MLWLCILALFLQLGLVGAATARECGGRVVCGCGDHVVRDYELIGDLGPCKKHGLTLARGVVLDGGGHLIRGSRAKSSAGVTLSEKSTGAQVRNLEIVGFERGLRLAGVENARVENVEAHHNGDPVAHKGYGIDVARGASRNVIQNVYVHHNADEGIHVGSDAVGNRIRNSRFADNHRENVYFLENTGNSLEDSTLERGGTSSVFIKHAKDVLVRGNRIVGRGIQIRGASQGIRLENNVLDGVGLTVRPYEKGPRGKTVPRDVSVSGGKIRSENPCVRLIEARSVRLEGLELDCRTGLELAGDSDAISVRTDLGRVRCDGAGVVREERELEARFVGPGGAPVAGVQVQSPGGITIGEADGKGVLKTTLAVTTTRCPGPTVRDMDRLMVRAGDWSREMEVSSLTGDVSVGGGEEATDESR